MEEKTMQNDTDLEESYDKSEVSKINCFFIFNFYQLKVIWGNKSKKGWMNEWIFKNVISMMKPI